MPSDDSNLDSSSIKKENLHAMPKGNSLEGIQFPPAIQEEAKRVDVSSNKVLMVNVIVPSDGELVMLKAGDVGEDGCTTPRDQVMSKSCPPPAPRKPKSLPSKKRKMEDQSNSSKLVPIQVPHKEVQLLLFAQDFFCANMVKNKARKLI